VNASEAVNRRTNGRFPNVRDVTNFNVLLIVPVGK